MRKRQKASDVAREQRSRSLIPGTPSSFKDVFPEVRKLRLEVRETKYGNDLGAYSWVYTESNPPGQHINCTNPLCYNGGVSIGFILHAVTSGRKTQEEGYRSCQGYEGSPKGRKNYGPCDHGFRWKVDVEYEDEVGTG